MYQPRLAEMPRDKVKLFNEIRIMLKRGKIPASLINPALINQHNENSPFVAQINHGTQEISLDSLALLYAYDGIATRKHFRDMVISPRNADTPLEAVDLDATRSRSDRHQDIMENLK